MALPHAPRLPAIARLLPTLPACQPQARPRLRFSGHHISPHRGQVSSVVSGQVLCAANASVAAAPAPETEAGELVAPRTRLVAQNIPWDYTADDVSAVFEKHGAVVNVELSMYNSSKNRGLAFVTMGSEEEALEALNNLNSTILSEREIKVEFARPRKKQRKQPVAASDTNPKYILFVGNLTWRVRSVHLRELFGSTPGFLSAEVIFHTTTPRRSAGYAFVSFSSKEAAESAMSTFNGQNLMGRPINVMFKDDNAKKKKSSVPEEMEVKLPEQSDS